MENLKLLFQLYYRPISAMSEIMDKGNWFVAAILLFAVSIGFYFTVNSRLQNAYAVPQFDYSNYERLEYETETFETIKQREAMLAEYQKRLAERPKIPLLGDRFFTFFTFQPSNFLSPIISLACFYIPLTLLLVTLFGHLGSFSVVFGRHYGSLITCAMLAWAAAHLPFAIIGFLFDSQIFDPQIYLAMWILSGLFFGLLMIFALRVVCGVNYGAAILTVALSWLGFSFGMYVFRFISPWFISIALVAYLYFYGGGGAGMGDAFRQQQNFKRHLHNATVNPLDADAHVQLGLIYNQRRQTDKAFEHFNKAFEIDKTEPDANYELGKIARQKGEFQKAIEHFSVVVEQNDKYALSEIWREIGATYMDAKMFAEAKNALETFVERRPVDAEGLYYFGKVLKELGENDKAKEMFLEAIESAKTSPDYRKYAVKQWSKLAEKEL